MKRKTRADKPLELLRRALFASVLVGLLAPTLHAQAIRIKVLNGRNGKPVTNECLNVWLGPAYHKNLIAPTDIDGIVILHFDRNAVWSDTVSPSACNGLATIGRKLLQNSVERIAISGDYFVPCQEYGKPTRGETLTPSFGDSQVPSFSIKTILSSGLASGNTCGKTRITAKPGELIFFMRPMSFWEKMKL